MAYLDRLADSTGDDINARGWLDEALRLSRDLGAGEPELDAMLFLALHLHRAGDDDTALAHAEQCWQVAEQTGGRSQRAKAILAPGHVRSSLNRLTEAEAAYQQALAQVEDILNVLAGHPRAGFEVSRIF